MGRQAETTSSSKEVTAKDLIELHGGMLTISSEKDVGTTTFPAEQVRGFEGNDIGERVWLFLAHSRHSRRLP
jgi:hypothetical protein